MEIKKILENKDILGQEVEVSGWVRFNRPSKNIGFIELTDGSKINGIQLVYKREDEALFEKLESASLYSYITIIGIVVEGKEQFEIQVKELKDIREVSEEFPIGKKEHGLEFLRDNAHIRIKTKMFQAIMKVRSTASLAIHEFFAQEGFTYVHTPIITGNDAEGAGEAFFVKDAKGGTFYSNQGTLTVSGQLHAEGYAQALGKVYTFGPTFRAENSHTTKHASEFWMMEPEAAGYDYNDMMECGWDMIRFIINKVLEVNSDELQILSRIYERDMIEYLSGVANSDLKKISYRDAIKVLQDAMASGVEFEEKDIEFGIDLGTEHEKYISGVYANSPIYVYDYPADIKSFYMYQNGDGTVRGYDLLVPQIGELIGGSQREDRYDVLMDTLNKKGISPEGLEWYLDLRKDGYAKSTGFGIGFERLIMFLTGTENIRDVIPFPRTTGKLNF